MGFESRVLTTHEVSYDDWLGAEVTVNLLGKGDVSELVESIGQTVGVKAVQVLGEAD